MMVDLKPCPFCGCAPVVDGDKIVCPERHCWGPIVEHYDSIDDAAEAWNRRALSPAGTASEIEPVAWEGYWDGAGSISSETRYTRSIAAMEHWAADGAKITPLYALPPKTEGWQPIETAPKDGTRVDLWQQGHRFTEAFWDEGEEWWCIDSRYSDGEPCPLAVSPEPTHWMPLPAPPKAGE